MPGAVASHGHARGVIFSKENNRKEEVVKSKVNYNFSNLDKPRLLPVVEKNGDKNLNMNEDVTQRLKFDGVPINVSYYMQDDIDKPITDDYYYNLSKYSNNTISKSPYESTINVNNINTFSTDKRLTMSSLLEVVNNKHKKSHDIIKKV